MISVVIIAYEEEEQLPETLEQVTKFADEIILVDSYSEDRTAEIARKYGADVYQREWKGYTDAWNYGFSKASKEWTLQLGADEIPSDELVNFLSDIKSTDMDYTGYKIYSKNFVFGKELKHWSRYAPRLFESDSGQMSERAVHEQLEIEGEWGEIDFPINHKTYQNVSEYIDKLSRYTKLEAEEFESEPNFWQMYLRPVYHTIKLLILQKLILDGMDGVFIAIMSGIYEYIAAYRARLRLEKRPYE